MVMKRTPLVLLLSLCIGVSACTTSTPKFKKIRATKGTSQDVINVAKEPIYDTNLIKRDIPEQLKGIEKVYQAPASCTEYWQELVALDEVLGQDMTDIKVEESDSFTVNLSQAVSKTLVPNLTFGSVVQSLSGAKKHERERLNAIFRGKSRRSYIKGWASGQDC